MNVQDAIFRLSRFWADQGCLVLPPCELEIPGGILHPEVFFRLLDPKPWRAAYLQPVRRPLDGRYGRHPYRLGRHLQFQVVVKAPGGDVRELYLKSLEDLGLELADHDLRFAEWNWEALSLDAWGLGWHVLVDGLGVTRMTFLQQVAGRQLDPVALEISYGVERLLMAITRADDTFRLPWSDDGTEYGELWRRDEVELSRYAVEVADVDLVERQLAVLAEEARVALDAGLVRLSYELTVKALRGIDLLEMRGRLSTRERVERLSGVREMVREVAARYLDEEANPAVEVPEPQSTETQPPRTEGAEPESTEPAEPAKRKTAKRKRTRRKSKRKEST